MKTGSGCSGDYESENTPMENKPVGTVSCSSKETILRVLQADLSNAQDNVNRAEAQLRRMFYDHDTRDTLYRYQQWAFETQAAIDWIKNLPVQVLEPGSDKARQFDLEIKKAVRLPGDE